ncbi:MAG: fasciclin domain-containing protein [Prevotellaceae bacterium]|nr:fasciclin domain-containing protein [Prevotellaceae bacterium]
MKISKLKFFVAALLCVSAVQVAFVSCSDDPGVGNYYTSTKEYASDYLQNREQFSKYVEVLQRATGSEDRYRLVDLLSTWGLYTVFAPTNDAIDLFLESKGVGSVAELSKEDCDTIALNSIIESVAYFTTDVSDDTYKTPCMLGQYHSITVDTVTSVMYINSSSVLTHADDSVANGVVHTVDKVVLANTAILDDFLTDDENISLYVLALQVTHMADSLKRYIDNTYSVGKDSTDWDNPALVKKTAVEYDNVAYPKERKFWYTMFICPDSVLKEKYGITDLDGLKAKAKELYDPMYPEDADVDDVTDRRNSLNRFISYHILDRMGTYYQWTCEDGSGILPNAWMRDKIDISDYYETMMPYSLMKFSFPDAGAETGLYINRRGVAGHADERGEFVRGAKVTDLNEMKINNLCANGSYFYIDDIVAYDRNTQEKVLNERMRIDASTLSPDFMTSGARGIYTQSGVQGGRYGILDNSSTTANKNTCYGFKNGYVKNFVFNNGDGNTHLHVRPRTPSMWSYQGDEVTILGNFDFTVKLPPVPKGEYEVRLATCVEFESRGIVQVYLDGEPQGIPFDMRPNGITLYGWISDGDLGDDDAIAAFDKSIRNLGWMKGPKSYYNINDNTGAHNDCFRDLGNGRFVRKILGHFISDGKTEHYLRFQQKLDNPEGAMNFDFLELCPSTVYNNEYIAEDKW